MYQRAPLSRETAQITAAADDLAVDNARADLRRAEQLAEFCHDMTDAELRIVFGGHYDNWTRHYMEHRLMLNVLNAAKAVRAAEGHPDPEPKSFFGTAEWARQEDAHVASRGGWAGD